ncbi:stage III sporulation protein AF [Clostridium sp. YIM B02515]|uniref:Stage III sporulation protein AF n=1 Tax=Clostridium rhizosphaerae TaxID=2803861 RepID=A0ABS1TGK7_9CLOT|nr:stage III sporulation protein AF [Clostridium rhizosphaerae]MBL4937912.1 stage III sporulation protein AF [Clostridium rhizosphaerae]
MIDGLRNWIIEICTAVIFITAVEMILPNNNLKKYAKFVLGLILITVLINPIIKLFDKNFDLAAYTNKAYEYMDEKKYENDVEKYKQEGMNKTVSVFKENVENLCKEKLKEEFPRNNYKVDAAVDYDKSSDSVYVKNVKVGIKDGTIESVKKIDIGSKGAAASSNPSINDERSRLMKSYLSKELKISESSIEVYKN